MKQHSRAEKQLLGRIKDAKDDRYQFQNYINDCYEYGIPQRQLLGNKQQQPRNPEEQSDLFDTTLIEAIEDYASEQIDMLMPYYRPWVQWKPFDGIPTEFRKQVGEMSEQRSAALFDVIGRSNLSGVLPETWRDAAISAAGVLVRQTPLNQPIACEPVLCNELLIERGLYGGIDGRWRQWDCPVRLLKPIFGRLEGLGDIIRSKRSDMDQNANVTVEVVEGYHRDYDSEVEAWYHDIVIDGQVLRMESSEGQGACGLHVARSAISHPSAWGPGPAMRALPYARALNVMSYLELKAAGKIVDPPFSYVHTSIQNVEQGMEAGYGYPSLNPDPFTFYAPDGDLQFAVMASDQLRRGIRRSLYLDEPEQQGLTPPTLGQWMRQEARHARRVTLPRDMQVQEFILPLVRRFEWLAERRGDIEPIEINDRVFRLYPESPLSSARNMEDASRGYELTMQINQMFPQSAGLIIDAKQTAENLKEKRGDNLVVLRDPEDASAPEQEVLANASGGTRVNARTEVE